MGSPQLRKLATYKLGRSAGGGQGSYPETRNPHLSRPSHVLRTMGPALSAQPCQLVALELTGSQRFLKPPASLSPPHPSRRLEQLWRYPLYWRLSHSLTQRNKHRRRLSLSVLPSTMVAEGRIALAPQRLPSPEPYPLQGHTPACQGGYLLYLMAASSKGRALCRPPLSHPPSTNLQQLLLWPQPTLPLRLPTQSLSRRQWPPTP
jgi:hypothetical protein